MSRLYGNYIYRKGILYEKRKTFDFGNVRGSVRGACGGGGGLLLTGCPTPDSLPYEGKTIDTKYRGSWEVESIKFPGETLQTPPYIPPGSAGTTWTTVECEVGETTMGIYVDGRLKDFAIHLYSSGTTIKNALGIPQLTVKITGTGTAEFTFSNNGTVFYCRKAPQV
jgi:hypothetical protein